MECPRPAGRHGGGEIPRGERPGLRDAGYIYVVVDGGWRATKLGPRGELLEHPTKFPGGMKALADYAHARGMKFGVHIVPGTHDCGGDPVGALGQEEVQMKQLVDWGLDFIKIDRCRNLGSGLTTDNGWSEELVKSVYTKWSNLITQCGRDMVFSISAYRYRYWYPETCHMARTTYDITARVNGGAVFDFSLEEGEKRKRLAGKSGCIRARHLPPCYHPVCCPCAESAPHHLPAWRARALISPQAVDLSPCSRPSAICPPTGSHSPAAEIARVRPGCMARSRVARVHSRISSRNSRPAESRLSPHARRP